ncbi:MAG: hypothetical protein PF481_04030 [Bacteroidales bacterium]|jgi:hypothetical protein|nr:hypothetical protein [Bacteroidales bacterium]
MKKKSLFFSTLFIGVAFSTLLFNSCEKEDNALEPANTDANVTYSKDVQLYDKAGENSVIMRVSSDDQSLLKLYTSDNFEIIPIKNGQNLDEALVEHYGEINSIGADSAENLEDETPNLDENAQVIAFQIISKDLDDGVDNIAVNYVHPDDGDERAKWRYYDHYGYEDYVTITRVNFWRRVYCGVYYQASSPFSTWSTIVGTWYKLSNNEQINKGEVGSYRLKARIKTKKSSAYTIEFDD